MNSKLKFICLVGLIFIISNKFSDGILHNDEVVDTEENPKSTRPTTEQTTSIEVELKQNERENLDRLKTTSTSTQSETPTSTSTTATTVTKATTTTSTSSANTNENKIIEACSNDECVVRDGKRLILNDRINKKVAFNKIDSSKTQEDSTKTTKPNEIGDLNQENEQIKNLESDTKANAISDEALKQSIEPTNNETETTTKAQSSFVVDVVVPDMQSFEEWKEMKLKEMPESSSTSSQNPTPTQQSANQNQLNQQIKQQQQQQNIKKQANNIESSEKQQEEPVVVVSRRKNYAGLDCGAKIIENNPESSNPSHILTESKDDYMLNSCSAKVWFVIELCEPIKINEIELANFELFSNVPRQFRVYTSERYIKSSANNYNWPAKYLLGTFEAANTRTIQTFTSKEALVTKEANNEASNGNMGENGNGNGIHSSNGQYVKYVKFEMLSHYGTEHYCPISLVRIYGTTKGDDTISNTDELQTNAFVMVGSSLDLQTNTKINQEPKQDEVLSKQAELEVKSNSNKAASQFFEMTSNFLSNVISSFMKENFNLAKLFDCFANSHKINTKLSQNEFDVNTIELSLIDKPSKSTRIIDTKHVVLNESNKNYKSETNENDVFFKQMMYSLKQRNQVIQMDLHKVLCFSGSSRSSSVNIGSETLDCCQCISESKPNEKGSDGAYNWLSKYCGYYFLMTTAAKARSNESLLFNYMSNMKYFMPASNDSENEKNIKSSVLNNGSFTHISINSIDYFILNEWLDKQALKANLEKSKPNKKKKINEEKPIEQSTNTDELKEEVTTASTTTSAIVEDLNTEAVKTEPSKIEIVGAVEMEKILSSRDDKEIGETMETKTRPSKPEQIEPKIISENKNEADSANKSQTALNKQEEEKEKTAPTKTSTDNLVTELQTSLKTKSQDSNEKADQLAEALDNEPNKSEPANEPDKVIKEAASTATIPTTTVKSESNIPTATGANNQKVPSVEDIKNSMDQIIKIANIKISPQIESTTSTTPTTSNPPSPTPLNAHIISNLKEDIFTHLNNRIKVLEFNMSLSSQYLEKLSQHYRKQLDEMQKAFNVTTTALFKTIQVANEKDIKQNERIMVVEKRLDKMQQTVDSLSSFLNELEFQTNMLILAVMGVTILLIVAQIFQCILTSSKKTKPKEKSLNACNNNEKPSEPLKPLTPAQIEKLIEERVNKLLEKHLQQHGSQLNETSNQITFETLGPALANQINNLKSTNISSSSSSDPLMHHSSSSTILPSIATSSNLFSASEADLNQQQQQQVAAAALVSTVSTVAVVAAVSFAAATASCNSLTQSPNEEKF